MTGLTVGTASGNKDTTEIHVGTASGDKQVTEGWVGTASGNKQFYSVAPALTADASPNSQGWSTEAGPDDLPPKGPDYTIYSANISVTPSGGQAPYSYAWSQLTGADAGITAPTSASSDLFNTSGGTCTFNCTVTDNLGTVATSDTITVS